MFLLSQIFHSGKSFSLWIKRRKKSRIEPNRIFYISCRLFFNKVSMMFIIYFHASKNGTNLPDVKTYCNKMEQLAISPPLLKCHVWNILYFISNTLHIFDSFPSENWFQSDKLTYGAYNKHTNVNLKIILLFLSFEFLSLRHFRKVTFWYPWTMPLLLVSVSGKSPPNL